MPRDGACDVSGGGASSLPSTCKRAHIPYGQKTGGVTWHSMTRHTGASRMVDNNVHIRTLQELRDWKTLSQLQKYGHPSEDAKRAGVEAVAAATERAAATPAPSGVGNEAIIAIAHRVRHRPDLEQLEAEAIAAIKRLVAEVAKLSTADLPNVTIPLRGSYAVRETEAKPAKSA